MADRDSRGMFVAGHKKVGNCGAPKGAHNSPVTEFKPGFKPWNFGKKSEKPAWNKGLCGVQTAWNKGLSGYKSPRKTPRNRVFKECSVCLKKYEPQYCVRKTSKFCSVRCHGFAKRAENSPHWKGGTGSERHQAMGKIEYKNWRISVFKKDNYSCVSCGASSTYLHADHIKPWKTHKELRYEVSNGQTLCIDCHYFKTFKRRASKETVLAWGVR